MKDDGPVNIKVPKGLEVTVFSGCYFNGNKQLTFSGKAPIPFIPQSMIVRPADEWKNFRCDQDACSEQEVHREDGTCMKCNAYERS